MTVIKEILEIITPEKLMGGYRRSFEKSLTVVVPCYNVERYVGKCVESLEKQGDVIREVLLIDDGSTDGTLDQMKQLALRYGNIRVIHKENEGAFKTRIRGIKEAKSEFITFADADDYLDDNIYPRLMEYFTSENLDILEFGCRRVCNGKEMPGYIPKNEEYDYKEGVRRLLERHDMSCSNCNKLYKKTLFDKVTFEEELNCREEDRYINLKVLCAACKVRSVSIVGYNYTVREGSTTNSQKSIGYLKILNAVDRVYHYVNACLPELSRAAAYDYCARIVYCYIYIWPDLR